MPVAQRVSERYYVLGMAVQHTCVRRFGATAVWIGVACGLVAAWAACARAQEGEAAAVKVEASVAAEAAANGQAEVMVLLSDQADLRDAYAMTDADARGWYVYDTLREQARRTQQPLGETLDRAGAAYRTFWAVNAIATTADPSRLAELAARRDVRRIESNRPVRWVDDPAADALILGPLEPAAIEWGVDNVNAPDVWALGFTGQGIVVANQDTGFEWQHPALLSHYRGWDGSTADHNYNWHDAIHSGGGGCGADSSVPCDDQSHGTHTMGTAIGSDGGTNQIGVAPGARWIGCRNMNQGVGTPATYTECFQFFLAPTTLVGTNADPTLRPHVMNNSWACPPSEGCAATTLQTAVENAEAAGIFVVASAGNSGPGCATVSDPPALYASAFTVGATTSTNVLAAFSSRGPVQVDGSNRMKPDLSAPGSSVRSSIPGGTYGFKSGTSMASPHVTGVVALLWAARPELARNIAATKAVLLATANPDVTLTSPQTCGGVPNTIVPNNSFGYGRVDVLAAVNAALLATPSPSPTRTPSASPTSTALPATPTRTPTGTPSPAPTATATAYPVSGQVRYYAADGPVAGVGVAVTGATSTSTTTDATGAFGWAALPAGTVTLTPALSGSFGIGVSALDASYVLQTTVGLRTPGANERLASDVTGDGTISSLDAARILQFVVGSSGRFPAAQACNSDWLFVPAPAGVLNQQVTTTLLTTGTCRMGAVGFAPLAGAATGQDFLGVLLGDASGNWQPIAGGTLSREDAAEGVVQVGRLRPRAGALDVPIALGAGAHAASLTVTYDASVLRPVAVRRPHAGGLLLAANLDEPGVVQVAVARAAANAPATILVRFRVLDARRVARTAFQVR